MKITVKGNVFEGTPEEIKELMTLMGAEFPAKAEAKPRTDKREARVGERIQNTDAGFAVGDYIVALPEADDEYAITTSKMKLGKVIEGKLYGSDDLRVEIIAHAWDRCIGFSHSVESKYFRKATDEEIEKYTKPKSGRNPGEFKKGDIVRTKFYGLLEVDSVDEKDEHPIKVTIEGEPDAMMAEGCELIAPVESRVDQ